MASFPLTQSVVNAREACRSKQADIIARAELQRQARGQCHVLAWPFLRLVHSCDHQLQYALLLILWVVFGMLWCLRATLMVAAATVATVAVLALVVVVSNTFFAERYPDSQQFGDPPARTAFTDLPVYGPIPNSTSSNEFHPSVYYPPAGTHHIPPTHALPPYNPRPQYSSERSTPAAPEKKPAVFWTKENKEMLAEVAVNIGVELLSQKMGGQASSPSGKVQVKGHFRDGKYVAPYERSYPKR